MPPGLVMAIWAPLPVVAASWASAMTSPSGFSGRGRCRGRAGPSVVLPIGRFASGADFVGGPVDDRLHGRVRVDVARDDDVVRLRPAADDVLGPRADRQVDRGDEPAEGQPLDQRPRLAAPGRSRTQFSAWWRVRDEEGVDPGGGPAGDRGGRRVLRRGRRSSGRRRRLVSSPWCMSTTCALTPFDWSSFEVRLMAATSSPNCRPRDGGGGDDEREVLQRDADDRRSSPRPASGCCTAGTRACRSSNVTLAPRKGKSVPS